MIRETASFGQGSFVGDIMVDTAFFDAPVRDRALDLAWRDGCPVAQELTDPLNTSPGRGPETMEGRYGEVNFWFVQIGRIVAETKPELYELLMTPVQRQPDEPVGKHEPESVPESYQTELAPMNTLPGYALSRVFIEQLGPKELTQAERQVRLIRGIEALDVATTLARTPMELLVLFGERLVRYGDVRPAQVLKHALSQGWLEEHNAHRTITEFKERMENSTPRLSGYYDVLSDEDKIRMNIV